MDYMDTSHWQFLKIVADDKSMSPPKQALNNLIDTVEENRKQYTK